MGQLTGARRRPRTRTGGRRREEARVSREREDRLFSSLSASAGIVLAVFFAAVGCPWWILVSVAVGHAAYEWRRYGRAP